MSITLREGNKAPKKIEGKEEILPKGTNTPKVMEPAENKIVDKPQEISYNDSNKENGYVGFENVKPKSQNSKSLNGMSFLEASKNDSFLENRYKFGPQFNEWLKKNHDAIKYSGDNTFNNIKNTMEKDVPRFMKDAPFNVDKNGLISSIVKWNLADKAGNKDLKDKAVKNTIGYMSEENQEEYLKDQQPLEDYVKASDDYDHQRGNFKTTEYSTSEPDEDVMKIQNLLVDLDYRNKYDEPIKVDGLAGTNTLYAADTLADVEKKPYELLVKPLEKVDYYDYDNQVVIPWGYDENADHITGVSFASAGGPVNVGGVFTYDVGKEKYSILYKNDEESLFESLKTRTSDGGILPKSDEGKNDLKKTMIKGLSSIWHKSKNKDIQEEVHIQADLLREFDDNHFTKATYLNNSEGAKDLGHNAIMLTNDDGYSLIFSFFSTKQDIGALLCLGEMRFAVLSPEQTKSIYNGKTTIENMISSNGGVKTEIYDRCITYDIDNGQGYNMYYNAVDLFDYPGIYSLLLWQCDNVASEIFNCGGININTAIIPNLTYLKENLKKKSKDWLKNFIDGTKKALKEHTKRWDWI